MGNAKRMKIEETKIQVPPFSFITNNSSACSGRRMAFRVSNSTSLDAIELSRRSSPSNPNDIVLLECTNFPAKSLSRGCHLSRVCFRTSINGPWKMGIVSNMVFCLYSQTSHDIQAYVPGLMHVYEWVGPVSLLDSVYVPDIYSLNIHCDLRNHFKLKKLVLADNTVGAFMCTCTKCAKTTRRFT